MQDESNTTLATVGGHNLELKPFITGRQAESLSKAQEGETVEDKNIARLHQAISLVVVAIDGKTENVLEAVLDLPFADYQEVSEKIGEIALGKKKEVSTPTT